MLLLMKKGLWGWPGLGAKSKRWWGDAAVMCHHSMELLH